MRSAQSIRTSFCRTRKTGQSQGQKLGAMTWNLSILLLFSISVNGCSGNEEQLRANYTVLVEHEGYNCSETRSSNDTNTEAWALYDTEETSRRNFEGCTETKWKREELNCDPSREEDDVCTEDGRIATDYATRPFDGKLSCTALIAFRNYRGGEARVEWDQFCNSKTYNVRRLDSTAYENHCCGNWRNCLFNWAFYGEVHPSFNKYNDARFHMHAHNVMDSRAMWGGFDSPKRYSNMADWCFWKRTTFNTGNDDLIYQGTRFTKCVGQSDFYVHVKGYVKRTFEHGSGYKVRNTDTCPTPYGCGGGDTCHGNSNDYCFMDFDTLKDDDSQCISAGVGPISWSYRNSWMIPCSDCGEPETCPRFFK